MHGLEPSLTHVLAVIWQPQNETCVPAWGHPQPASCQCAGFCSPLCKGALPLARPGLPHLFPEPGRPKVLASP